MIIYQKFVMDELFFSPFLANALLGSIDLIFSISLGLITFCKDGWFCKDTLKGKSCYLANFTDYFINFGKLDIICFISSICFKLVIYILNIYTIYYLGPNHILLIFIVGKFIENELEGQENIVANYILFSLLLIFFIFYLEIFELDFCGINHNTKQNIETRALVEASTNGKLMEKLTIKENMEDDVNGSFSLDSSVNSDDNNSDTSEAKISEKH